MNHLTVVFSTRRSRLAFNHNQTVVRQPGSSFQHNQTLVRR